jgi:hypothetical protein
MPCGRIPGPLCDKFEEWWGPERPVVNWSVKETVDDPAASPPQDGDQRIVRGSSWLPNLIVALDEFKNLVALRAKDDRAVVNVENVTLKQSERKGTPLGKHRFKGNTADVVKIRNLQVTGDASDKEVSAIGTLSVTNPADPERLTTPLDIDFRLNTTPLTLSTDGLTQGVRGNLSTLGGALKATFTANFSYDTDRVARALKGQGSTSDLAPSLDISGALELAIFKKIPLLQNIFRTQFELSAPTTAPLNTTMSGALFPFPASYKFKGIVPIPAGGLFDVQAAGYGMHSGRFDGKSGSSFTASITPVPLPPFPVYLYGDYYHVLKKSNGVEVGVRLTAALDKADFLKVFRNPGELFSGAEPPGGPDDAIQHLYKQASHRPWEPDSRYNAGADYKKPWLMGRLTVRW